MESQKGWLRVTDHVKPNLSLDFDGVLNSFESGWGPPDVLPDPPIEGAVDACHEYSRVFNLHVNSARCINNAAVVAVQRYLRDHKFPEGMRVGRGQKPIAELYIDDKAYLFKGTFPSVDYILNFKPWYEKPFEEEVTSDQVQQFLDERTDSLKEDPGNRGLPLLERLEKLLSRIPLDQKNA